MTIFLSKQYKNLINNNYVLMYISIDSKDQQTPLALVVYKFDGVPAHEVLIRPHGNAKKNKLYRRTRESTKVMIKAELENSKPKEAVDKVFTQKAVY